jgi:formate hydrogenlyase subunit 4
MWIALRSFLFKKKNISNMNTKLLMIAATLYLGIIGVLLIFLPQEISEYLQISSNMTGSLLLSLLGSLYLGFAMLNWMAKANIMGGIYSRPVAIGNFMHFGIGAITLLKLVFGIQYYTEIIIPLTIGYTFFAICFAYVFMTNPGKN